MTAPSKAVQNRPPVFVRKIETYGIVHSVPSYRKSEADAIFESLETELAVTRRALEMAAAYTDVDSFYFMNEARMELGQ